MITRVILVQLRPEVEEGDVEAVLACVPLVRQRCPGIIDIQVGATSYLSYTRSIVIRFANAYAQNLCLRNERYQKVLRELSSFCLDVLDFTIDGDELPIQAHNQDSSASLLAYGNFALTLEEHLRQFVRLWLRGDGQVLTDETILTNDPGDVLPVDLVMNLGDQIEREFGLELNQGLPEKWPLTFGDLTKHVEKLVQSKGK